MNKILRFLSLMVFSVILVGCTEPEDDLVTVTFDYDALDALEVEVQTDIDLPILDEEEHFFVGWRDQNETLYVDTYTVSDDVVLTPVFESFDDVLSLQFDDERNEVIIIEYTGDASYLIIPHTIDDYYVRSIARNAFEGSVAKIIKIPMTVYNIYMQAFKDMPNLEHVHYYGDYLGTVTAMITKEQYAAYMQDYDACELSEVPDYTIPTEENPWLFDEGCPIRKITEKTDDVVIGDQIYYSFVAEIDAALAPSSYLMQRIEPTAFEGSPNIKTITLPDKLFVFDPFIFDGLEHLETVKIENNPKIYSQDGIIFESETDKLRYYPSGRLDEDFILPASIEHIGGFAFFSNQVSTLSLHDNVEVDPAAFGYLKNLKEIQVNENNTTMSDINGVVYSKDHDELLVYPAGKVDSMYIIHEDTTIIGDYAFMNQQHLEYLPIPEGVKTIGFQAFLLNPSLHTVDLPTTLEVIHAGNFMNHDKVLHTLIVRRTDAVSITDGSFSHIAHPELIIYIPDDSMDTYASHVFWAYLEDYFVPLSELVE